MDAQENQVALPLRSHTIFGVCEAIGEDFGFNPVFLRMPFAAIVLWSPLWRSAPISRLGWSCSLAAALSAEGEGTEVVEPQAEQPVRERAA